MDTNKINSKTGKPKVSSRGGARANAGRPKGSTNKITMDNLLASLDSRLGMPYSDQIASNYAGALNREDWANVKDYDRLFVGKLVADKLEVESINNEDVLEAKKLAFAEAIAKLADIGSKE
jgi:hypothetical protein